MSNKKHCNLCKNDSGLDEEGEYSGNCWCKCHNNKRSSPKMEKKLKQKTDGEVSTKSIMNDIKKMEKKHTPTPYKAKPARLNPKDPMFYKADVIAGGICLACVAGVGELQANANAAFIVRACNSHEKLLEACKEMLGALSIMQAPGLEKYKQAIAEAEA